MTAETLFTEERVDALDQSLVPAANSAADVLDLLGMLANRLKAATGKANWYDAPDATLAALAAHVGSTNGHPAATGSASGFMTASQFTKLSGIETGATADMTAAEILAAIKGVDGPASGLDADLLDGLEASAFVLANTRGAANGVATLDSSGQVPEAQIPAVAITDVFEVSSQSAMLALTAQRGDVAVRSDLNKSFVLRATPASTLSNWSELRTPTDAVLSVDGLVGAVTLPTDAAAGTGSKRTLGTGSQQAAAGNDSRITGAQQTSEKNAANGYAGLNGSGFVDPVRLGSGTRDATTVLYGDGTFKTAPSGGSGGGGTTPTVQDEGTSLTQRAVYNFVGTGVTATDDSANGRTNISIPRMTAQEILSSLVTVDGAGSGLDADLLDGLTSADFLRSNLLNAANGVAGLDSTTKIPVSLLPDAVIGGVNYRGTWNAATNSPQLASSSGTKGHYYRVSTDGSTSLNGITDWKVGDWAIYNGSAWEKVDNTDQVTSVFGRLGAVVPVAGDYNAGQVTNTPAGNISATTVQAALNELDAEKQPAGNYAPATHGHTSSDLPAATETGSGIAELATAAEVQTGTDTVRIVTPAGLTARTATETRAGIAEIATQTETNVGTDDERIVTPLKLAAILAAQKEIAFALLPLSVRRSEIEIPVSNVKAGNYTRFRVSLTTAASSGNTTIAIYKNRSTTAHDAITVSAGGTANNKLLATNLVLAEGDTVTIGATAVGTGAAGLAVVIS